MIALNFEHIYEIKAAEFDGKTFLAEFDAPQKDGSTIHMYVKLTRHWDPFLLDVFNLCLGPLNTAGEIDDRIRLKHENISKVISTTIFIAYLFLLDHPASTIGLDGSNDLRASLYHSMFVCNRIVMGSFFVCTGVDWYVKLLRNRRGLERDAAGNVLFKPWIKAFDYFRKRTELYGYYMFLLR